MTAPYQDILDFWFFPEDHENHGSKRPEWFQKNDDFDQEIRRRFLDNFEQAEQGHLLAWTDEAKGCMALLLLFDQFTRNMFRNNPRSFSADAKARAIARHMLEKGFFERLPSIMKKFAALPFEHSENLDDQKISMKLFQEFGDEDDILYAQRHFDIIERFGRFPHRNEVLKRPSTEEELAFLKQPNSSF
ncbi:MAG: DUF924 domain-containing protein [Sneathiellales bacterium]|nr:DUF924 domain-containing protein [Sneathiellales bacterium]